MQSNWVNKILDFAILQEEKAAQFYTELAGKMPHKHLTEALLGFAEEEKGHKEELMAFAGAVLEGGEWPSPLWQQVQATRIALRVEDQLHR